VSVISPCDVDVLTDEELLADREEFDAGPVMTALRHTGVGRPRMAGLGIVHRIKDVQVSFNFRCTEAALHSVWACVGWSTSVDLLPPSTPLTCKWCIANDRAASVGARLGELCIYYAQREGASQIKIGVSTNVGIRIRSLKANLLAVEPMRLYITEQARHTQFDHLRTDGEWFRAGDDLLTHIAELQATEAEAS
jgi:hypothetical protein